MQQEIQSEADIKNKLTPEQYKVLRDGTGKSPKITDQVTIHYRGTLTNGEEFDSSIKRGEHYYYVRPKKNWKNRTS